MNWAGPLTKPAKGSGLIARRERRLQVESDERREKKAVRTRDRNRCRWPRCEHRRLRVRVEVAHLEDKGMGGDHGLRTRADRMLVLCFLHHQGAKSLHSGHLEIVPMTTAGTNGPCLFYEIQNGERVKVAGEIACGIPEVVSND